MMEGVNERHFGRVFTIQDLIPSDRKGVSSAE